MKKLLCSSLIVAALICTTGVMAQDASKKSNQVKPKTEAKSEPAKTTGSQVTPAKTEAKADQKTDKACSAKDKAAKKSEATPKTK